MRINGNLFYLPPDLGLTGFVRIYYILWCVDSQGNFTNPDSNTYSVSGVVYKNQGRMPELKRVYGLEAGEDGFFSGSVALAWDASGLQADPEKLLVCSFTGDENTIRLTPKKLPYPVGAWAQVYLNACKLGVLTMANQSEPLDVLMNRIVDNIRSGLQIVPGTGNQGFYVETAPASGGSWGEPLSFAFESVGFSIMNYGAIPVLFSIDGINVAGKVPAQMARTFDFRRASQIYLQAATSDLLVGVEAW